MPSALRLAALSVVTLASSTALFAQTKPALTAAPGYTLGVFAKGVTGKYTVPDSIAVDPIHIFVGYGDGNKPDGSDAKNTQLVQYGPAGNVEFIYTVAGHNDGLKVDPSTNLLWALQNEDASANLYIINAATHEKTRYNFQASTSPAGGGYDDIVFRGGKTYLSASNPAHNPNNGAAIVEAKLEGTSIAVSPILAGNAAAIDVVSGAAVKLNLQDPDSMTLDASGDLFLTSQADGELIIVRQPGERAQTALQIPLTSTYGTPQVDDTVFIPGTDGYLLIADKAANTIYTLRRSAFVPGSAFSAAQVATGSTTVSFLGELNTTTGVLTPIVTGLGNPGGLAYVQVGVSPQEQTHP